ncbi:hypothetical protein [Noviherbaspirillum saxi]|uniref:CdiI immunity protein domain-containing protein n=1 Tax=Noviherbaspirillum saxi TaxID=2320863 RepID=A0A3A3FQD0_9BURK|nr:hypothetical protein [Noviherbaspirillum saxi]RJF98073.1 hypothetical protein D3871_05760 [Noviherbaspirillum saxi]
MMTDKLTEFKEDIATYWHCEARDKDTGLMLLNDLRKARHPINEEEFIQFLTDAILNKSISIMEYEQLTSLDFESDDEVAEDLRDLWWMLYGDRPIGLLGAL